MNRNALVFSILSLVLLPRNHSGCQVPPGYSEVTVESGITGVQPMTGIVFWSESPHTASDAISLEFSYMLFNQVVSDSGSYDWGAVESKLDAIAGRGHQAIFRFRYTYPGRETSVPEYIKAIPGYEETKGLSEGRETWFPDWTHPELMRFTLEFYSRFAGRYDNDPRLAFIQVGFGLWGEYHIYDGPFIPGRTFPSKDFQETFFRHLESVFLHTPWSISIDAADDTYSPFSEVPELKEIRFGLFDDSFMHEKHSAYPGEYNASGWRFFGEERWLTSPAGGEFSYYTAYDQEHVLDPEGPHGRSFESFASQYHITYMIGNDQPRYQAMDRIRQASHACGYRFRVEGFYVKADSARVIVRNIGNAPLYHDAYVAVNGIRCETSLKGLPPGTAAGFRVASGTAAGGPLPSLAIESDRLPEGKEIQFMGTTSVGTGRPEMPGEKVRVSAQPGGLLVDYTGEGRADVSLFDLSGRKIRRETGIRTVRISGLGTGCYFLHISASGSTVSRKVFIHRGT